jgi:hypothetical protein
MGSTMKGITAALAITMLMLGTAYLVARRVTALQAARFAVKKAGLPVEVLSADWDATWGGLRRGEIPRVNVSAMAAGGLVFDIDAPVRFQWGRDHLDVVLGPVLKVILRHNALKAPLALGGSLELHAMKNDLRVSWSLASAESVEHDFTGAQIATDSPRAEGEVEYKNGVIAGKIKAESKGFQGLIGQSFIDAGPVAMEAEGTVEPPSGGKPLSASLSKFTMRENPGRSRAAAP